MRKVSKARSAPTEATEVEQEETETPTGATPTKRTASKAEKKEIEPANANGSSSASAAADADNSDSDGPESFEVESILDSRVRHGKQQFKIRWKGYGPADDTWEDEENVDSPDLIAAFLKGPSKSVKSPPKKKKTASPKGKKRANSAESKTKPLKKAKSSDPSNDDSDAEYEVSKIMDYVELKDGTRQFLVRWKGFSAKQNTWEPEANLNCQDLIEKFLALEQEREDTSRETRVVRKQVFKYNPELTKRSSHRTSTKKSEGGSSCDDSVDAISFSHRQHGSSSSYNYKYTSPWRNKGSYSFTTSSMADNNPWYSKISSQCSLM